MKNADPEDIAAGIVGLICKPRPRVRVTKLAGVLSAAQKFMPRTVAEGLTRALGGEKVLLDDVDTDRRRITKPAPDTASRGNRLASRQAGAANIGSDAKRSRYSYQFRVPKQPDYAATCRYGYSVPSAVKASP